MPALWIDLPVPEMARRYEAGESLRVLGLAYGVGGSTVGRRLRAAGVKMRPSGRHLGSRGRLGWHKRGGSLFSVSAGYLGSIDREGSIRYIHRACWEAEHGRVPSGSVVHHINSDKLDNRIENLDCMSQSEHTRLHHLRNGSFA